jgi:hypothetical protein
LQALRADAGPATLDSLLRSIAQLRRLRSLTLPTALLGTVSPQVLRSYQRRIAAEEAYELRRHPVPLRMLLLTVFCHYRRQELTDRLVDLLAALVHRIGARAEQRIEQELLEDLKRVAGKTGLLFRLAQASLAQPEGTVKQMIFPVADESTLRALIQESQASGPGYRRSLQLRISASYRWHYRRMLAPLLNTLTFRSNNKRHQPVIDALALLKHYLGRKCRTYPARETVPLDGVVPPLWRAAVQFQDARGRPRVHRLGYEICVLQRLASSFAAGKSGWKARIATAIPTRICRPISKPSGTSITSSSANLWTPRPLSRPSNRACARS